MTRPSYKARDSQARRIARVLVERPELGHVSRIAAIANVPEARARRILEQLERVGAVVHDAQGWRKK